MELSFTDRIEAEIRRGQIHSPEDEERAQLENWLDQGVPEMGTPARRLTNDDKD